MGPTERRVRALEARLSLRGIKPPPRVVVWPGETLDAVLARDGVAPVARQARGYPTLIVRHIVDPVENANAICDIEGGGGQDSISVTPQG